jgi:type I restriction enzyme, S subunit
MTGRTVAALADVLADARSGFACGEDAEDGVFQFRMNNITTEGQIDLTKKRRVPRDTRNISSFLIEPGDVLFNATNSPDLVGKTAYFPGLDEPAVFSNHFLRLRPQAARVSGRYLSRWLNLQFEQGRFRGMCRQWVNQATVSRDALLALRLSLPPLTEQRRIAEILDKADALRAKRRAALAQLDTLAQSIFLGMFGDPATNPRGWREAVLLGDVADVVSGVTIGRSLAGKRTRTVPYLAVVNVQDRSLDLSVTKTTQATEEEIQRYRLMRDDLLLTEGGDPDKLGRGTLWNDQLPECIHQNHVFRVRLHSKELTPMFLSWLVGSQRGKRYFLRSAKQTTGIASINMTQLRAFPLLLPPLTLQHEFADQIAACDKLRAASSAHLDELEALFRSLRDRSFSGEP